MNDTKDYMVRAKAANDQIRAFAVRTTQTIEEERRIHQYSPVATAAIGRLMTAGLMMGDMLMNEKDVITLQIHGTGPLEYLVVTSRNNGQVRGYVKNGDCVLEEANDTGHLPVGKAIGKGTLTIIQDLGMREPYTTEIDLHSGEIADDLTYYYAQSEQTPTSVGLGVLFEKDSVQVKEAGGYIVQLLPNTDEEVIDRLEKNIAEINGVTDILKENPAPEAILEKVLKGFDIQFTGKKDVCFHCDCSHQSGRRLLKATGKKEIDEMVKENKPVEVVCGFCGKKYEYSVDELIEIQAELK